MNEKLEKKIRKLLAKAGLEEEEIQNIIDEINNSNVEEVEEGEPVEEEVNPAENPEVVEEVPADVPPVEEQAVEEVAPAEIPPEQVAESEALPLAEEQPPVEEVAPVQEPGPDPLVVELQGLLQEAQKAIEGLTARIGSLEEALQNAGVVEGGTAEVGDETPKLTPQHDDDGEQVLDDVIRHINGR